MLTDREAIWRPDSFFRNERRAYRHKIEKPNVLMRILPDGSVIYSERLTLTLSCPMYLEMFPMDEQKCGFDVASYADTAEDIVYNWKEAHPLQLMADIGTSLPSFKLIGHETSSCTSKTNTGEYSCLRATLILARQFRWYLLQVYIPSAMLVIVSWVSFWLDREAVSARVTLGIATLLTLTIQSTVINMKLPPVSYTKAIDVWIGTCLSFVFAALIEYAYVNYVETQDREFAATSRSSSTEKSSHLDSTEKEKLLAKSRANTGCAILHGSDKGKQVDFTSRIFFPLAFLVFTIAYWSYCYMNAKLF